jgi:WD repeat-containing protein 68
MLQVQIVSLDEESSDFVARSIFEHPYPTTKIMWIPDSVCRLIICFLQGIFNMELIIFYSQKGVYPDLLATSGDYLRVWRVDTETRIECLLNNVIIRLWARVISM